MRIDSERSLELALAEFQKLAEAAPDSAEFARRRELDGAIQEYYARSKDDLRKGRPEHTE